MNLEAGNPSENLPDGHTNEESAQTPLIRNNVMNESIAGPSGTRITTHACHKPGPINNDRVANLEQAISRPNSQKIVSSRRVASRFTACDCPVAERFYAHQHSQERPSRNPSVVAAWKRNRKLVEYRRETQKFRRELRRLWQDMDRLMNAIANYRLRRVPPAG